jgi:hypothetical protein
VKKIRFRKNRVASVWGRKHPIFGHLIVCKAYFCKLKTPRKSRTFLGGRRWRKEVNLSQALPLTDGQPCRVGRVRTDSPPGSLPWLLWPQNGPPAQDRRGPEGTGGDRRGQEEDWRTWMVGDVGDQSTKCFDIYNVSENLGESPHIRCFIFVIPMNGLFTWGYNLPFSDSCREIG